MKKNTYRSYGYISQDKKHNKEKKSTDTYRIIRGHTQIWNFSATVQLNISRSKKVRS